MKYTAHHTSIHRNGMPFVFIGVAANGDATQEEVIEFVGSLVEALGLISKFHDMGLTNIKVDGGVITGNMRLAER